MVKRLMLSTVFIALLVISGGNNVYAQSPYCTPNPNLPSQAGSPYFKSYCSISRSRDNDKTFQTVANQLGFKKADTVKAIVNFEPFAWKDIPTAVLKTVLSSTDRGQLTNNDRYVLYRIVRETYNRENQYAQMKSAITGKLKAKEIWMDGSLSNGPFDVIVDLNLIDVVLFGSAATWKTDIYSFPPPSNDSDKTSGSSPGAKVATPTPAGTAPPEKNKNPTQTAMSVSAAPETTKQIVCIDPNDPSDPLFSYLATAVKPNCGDDKLQSNEGETCDDGNTTAGDGCDSDCNIEQNGNSLMCIDSQAVTLKDFTPSSVPKIDGINTPAVTKPTVITDYTGCKEGAVAVKLPPNQAPGADRGTSPEQYPQSSNYPGPFIGGVLKNFPPSKKPFCPDGTSQFSVEILGKEEKVCLPINFCASFNDMRETLKPGYKSLAKDDPSRQAIEAIEALVCVNVSTNNRPDSPYALNEGCIDCHLAAIKDTMEEMRSKSIAPLENTKQAFAISNKYGPTFSLGLNTYERASKIKPFVSHASPPIEQVKRITEKAQELKCGTNNPECIPQIPAYSSNTSFDSIIDPLINNKTEKDMRFADTIKSFRATRGAADDQYFTKSMKALSGLNNAFKKLQAVYGQLAGMQPKKICDNC